MRAVCLLRDVPSILVTVEHVRGRGMGRRGGVPVEVRGAGRYVISRTSCWSTESSFSDRPDPQIDMRVSLTEPSEQQEVDALSV